MKLFKSSTEKMIDEKIFEIMTQVNNKKNAHAQEYLQEQLTFWVEQKNNYLKTKDKLTKDEILKSLTQVFTTGAGVLSLLLILRYEAEDVISSKGFSIATKMLGK
jgi:hypothetical protein